MNSLFSPIKWLSGIAIVGILFYQRTLSLWLGPRCRFYPTCSAYALESFRIYPFFTALGLTAKRLAKCHPFHPGGVDFLERPCHGTH